MPHDEACGHGLPMDEERRAFHRLGSRLFAAGFDLPVAEAPDQAGQDDFVPHLGRHRDGQGRERHNHSGQHRIDVLAIGFQLDLVCARPTEHFAIVSRKPGLPLEFGHCADCRPQAVYLGLKLGEQNAVEFVFADGFGIHE